MNERQLTQAGERAGLKPLSRLTHERQILISRRAVPTTALESRQAPRAFLVRLLLALTVLAQGIFNTCPIRAQSGAPAIWVLHDEDPNYSNPTVGDTLSALSDSGDAFFTTAGINICQTVGAWRALSVTDQGRSAIVCEFCGGNRLSKFGPDGVRLFSVPGAFYAADVGPSGTIFALTSAGTIYGESLYKLSAQGAVINQNTIGGIDLAVDENHQRIYVVGADIKCADMNLNLLWTDSIITWAAVSVDVASDGSAWVAERQHPDIPSSVNRLLHLAPNGGLLLAIDLAFSPFCVRVDQADDSVYVIGQNLSKYDAHGSLLFSQPLHGAPPMGWSLAIDHARQVWVGTWSDVQKFAPDGTFILSASAFGYSSDTFVAALKQAASIHYPPVAKCTNVVVSAGTNCLAQASINNGWFSPDNNPITLMQFPPGPYPVGTNRVTLMVLDSFNASNYCAADVIVLDTTAPEIRCPADIVVTNAHAAWNSVVQFAPNVADNCPGAVVVANPPSGSVFGVGVHPVTCMAVDAAGNSSQCAFQVTVWPGNRPPVPIITVSPLALFPDETNLMVIAADSLAAAVVLDGSKSYDPDHDRFSYSWWEGANPLSTNPVTTNRLAMGQHTITLALDDTFPLGTNSARVQVRVISTADAVGIVMGLVTNSALPDNRKPPLLASLEAAASSFGRGDQVSGMNQLQAFQNKLQAQTVSLDSSLAQRLIEAAQTILNAL